MFKRFVSFFLVILTLTPSIKAIASTMPDSEPPLTAAQIVQQGGYNIVAIHEEIGFVALKQVQTMLTKEYEDELLLWTVEEADGIQHVFAYPMRENQVSKIMGEKIEEIVNTYGTFSVYSPDHIDATWVCNELYWHAFYLGSVFRICGYQGTGGHGYANLGSYGFDNVASSYYETNPSAAIDIYDGYNYTNYIGLIVSDWGLFNSTYNDKASSVWGHY